MNVSSKAKLGILDYVLVTFIVLKLVHVIDWPWSWVLTPLYISLGLGVEKFIGDKLLGLIYGGK